MGIIFSLPHILSENVKNKHQITKIELENLIKLNKNMELSTSLIEQHKPKNIKEINGSNFLG